MCTLCVKIKFIKIIFGTSLCYNRKKFWLIQVKRDREIMGDRNGPT